MIVDHAPQSFKAIGEHLCPLYRGGPPSEAAHPLLTVGQVPSRRGSVRGAPFDERSNAREVGHEVPVPMSNPLHCGFVVKSGTPFGFRSNRKLPGLKESQQRHHFVAGIPGVHAFLRKVS
jgi:hypothetical protein